MAAARASGTQGAGGSNGAGEEPLPFRRAVAALAGAPRRAGVALEPLPAPRRLAPYAHALGVSVDDDGEEVADGRFVLLHDPAGHDAWRGAYRVVTLARTGLEPEMAVDPLLPEVTWSWLTGALDTHGVGWEEPSGTVTRSGSHFFGGIADREPVSELEVRASWTPAAPPGPDAVPDVAAHLTAWCELLCQLAGLPPRDGDGGPVVPLPHRRGPKPL
jgi:hypothetical protein